MNTYDPATHEYRMSGALVASVTKVLPEQKFYCSAEQLEAAREDGEETHDLINMFFDTGSPGSNPMLNALARWIDKNPQIGNLVLHERPLFSVKHRYAGRPDAIFEKAIIDFKRSRGNSKYHALQLGGYHAMAIENNIIKKTKTWLILWFDGKEFKSVNVYNEKAERVFIDLVHRYYIDKAVKEYFN